MDSEALKLKIDSSQARQDLDALARSLDKASKAAGSMQSNLARGVEKSNATLVQGAKNMEKFAQVTAQLSKVKLSGDPAKQITEFANAVAAVARVRDISPTKLAGLSKFVAVGAQISKLRFSSESFAGLNSFTKALNEAGSARGVSAAKLKSWVDFVSVAAQVQRLRFSPQTAQSLKAFGDAMESVAKARSISASKLGLIRELFSVLSSAKPIANASAIARDLDQIATAAARATKALEGLKSARAGTRMSTGRSGSGGGGGGVTEAVANSTKKFNQEIAKTHEASEKAKKGVISFGNSLDGLSARFKLSYQAGTLFTALFSSFTFGQLIKGIYDTSVSFQKLNKAMLFVTGTYEGAHKATQDFINISNSLGGSIEDNADAYSRFAISAGAAGLKLGEVNKIYKGAQLALTAVGANTEQVGYAFYGLSQAMAKGKISSEEFNRQIGEQIPGNAQAGARALSKLTGQQKSVADLFDEMRKGTIQSAPFLKAWADELERMYAPLLPEAEKRPDFQLNRLNNAFTLWKKAVGESQFIGALVGELKSLSNMLLVTENGQVKLSATGQKLADSFGKGLASAVHLAGDAIRFIVDNLDSIIAGMKGLLVLGVAGEIAKWSTSFTAFADKMVKAAQANVLFTTSEANKAKVTKAAETEIVAATTAGSASSTLAGRMDGVINRNRTPNSGGFGPGAAPGSRQVANFASMSYLMGDPTSTARGYGAFGRRAGNSMAIGGAGNALSRAGFPAARVGANIAGGLGSTLAAGASGTAAAFTRLGAILPGIGTLVTGAAVALALFGNKATEFKTAAQNSVTYNDLVMASFADMGNSISKWVSTLSGGAIDLGKDSQFFGRAVALIMASIKTVVGGLFTLASTIGKVLGGLISDVVLMAVDAARAVGRAFKGDFAGAKKVWEDGSALRQKQATDLGDSIKNDFKVFDVKANYQAIMDGAFRAADKRGQDQQNADAATAAQKAIEAALAQNKAADMQAAAAADMKAATDNFKQAVAPLNFDDLMKRIVALNDGSFLKTAKATGVAAAGASSSAPVTPEQAKALAGSLGDKLYASAATKQGMTANKDAGSLQAYFKANGVTIDPKKLAWCAAFVNAVLAQNGQAGTGSLAASSFRDYGDQVAKGDAKKGDIVVMKPLVAGTTGHVGFLDGFDRHGNPRVLGGNQGGGVKVSTFTSDKVLSYRRAGSAGAAQNGFGTALTAEDSEDGQKLQERRMNAYKNLNTLLGQSSPLNDAIGDYAANLEKLRDIIVSEEKLGAAKGEGFKSFFDNAMIEKTILLNQRLTKKIEEAANPITKETRLLKESNDILALRAKGLNDAADWQEKLNGLREQGYDVDLMQDEAKWTSYLNELKKTGLDIDVKALQLKPDELRAQQSRTNALQAELDLRTALADAQAKSLSRGASSRDQDLTQMILGRRKEGEDFGQTRNRLANERTADGRSTLDILGQTANVNEASRKQDVAADMTSRLRIMQETSKLSAAQKSFYDDYLQSLSDLTGKTGKSLGELVASTDEQTKRLAESFAKAKQSFENPPGFQKWADALEPLEKRMQDIKANFMDDLSGGITDALLGEDVDWQAMLHNTFKQMLRAQVDNALGSVVKAFTGQDPNAQAKTPEAQALVSAADVQTQAANTLQQAANGLLQVTQGAGGPGMVPGAAPGMPGAVGGMPMTLPPGMSPLQGLAAQGINAGIQGVGSLIGGDPTQNTGARSFGQRVGGIFSSIGSMFGFGAPQRGGAVIAPGGLGATGQTQVTGGGFGAIMTALGVGGFQGSKTAVAGSSQAGGSTAISDALTMGGDLSRNAGMTNALQIGSATISIGSANISGGGVGGGGAGGMGGGLVGGAGGPVAAGGGGAGLGGLLSGLGGGSAGITAPAVNPVSIMDNVLSPLKVDQTGGPGFQSAEQISSMLSGLNITPPGAGGGFFSGIGNMFSQGMAAIGPMMQGVMSFAGPLLGSLLTGGKKRNNQPVTYRTPAGVFGQASVNNVSATYVGAKQNPFAAIANLAFQLATGGMGGGAGMAGGPLGGIMSMFGGGAGGGMGGLAGMMGGAGGGMGMLGGMMGSNPLAGLGGGLFGMFKEGGYTGSPVSLASVSSMGAWHNAPHYAQGTTNTSLPNGGMAAIVHPNEAVIPLSRGRSIPVEMPEHMAGGGGQVVNSNITVYANDADSFRSAQSQIARKQNRTLKRAALRNATMAA